VAGHTQCHLPAYWLSKHKPHEPGPNLNGGVCVAKHPPLARSATLPNSPPYAYNWTCSVNSTPAQVNMPTHTQPRSAYIHLYMQTCPCTYKQTCPGQHTYTSSPVQVNIHTQADLPRSTYIDLPQSTYQSYTSRPYLPTIQGFPGLSRDLKCDPGILSCDPGIQVMQEF
jgi:hypothetical protein